MRLSQDFETGCASGGHPMLSELSWGWVIHPESYDAASITQEDCRHDHALRTLEESEALAIAGGVDPTADVHVTTPANFVEFALDGSESPMSLVDAKICGMINLHAVDRWSPARAVAAALDLSAKRRGTPVAIVGLTASTLYGTGGLHEHLVAHEDVEGYEEESDCVTTYQARTSAGPASIIVVLSEARLLATHDGADLGPATPTHAGSALRSNGQPWGWDGALCRVHYSQGPARG